MSEETNDQFLHFVERKIIFSFAHFANIIRLEANRNCVRSIEPFFNCGKLSELYKVDSLNAHACV